MKSKLTLNKIFVVIGALLIIFSDLIIIINTDTSKWQMDKFYEIDEVVLSNEDEIVNIISNYITIKEKAKNIIPDLELEYDNVNIKITPKESKVLVYATISEGNIGDMCNEVVYEYKDESIVKIQQEDYTYSNSLNSFVMYISLIDCFIFVVLILIYWGVLELIIKRENNKHYIKS